MANDPQMIEFRRIGWTDQAAQLLSGAQGSHPTYTLEELRREVEQGTSQLMQVIDHNGDRPALIGYAVVWIETFGGNSEMVIQAGEALTETYRVMPWVMPAFDRLARANGCMSLRAHVDARKRPAMVRALAKNGFTKAEIVMRREL